MCLLSGLLTYANPEFGRTVLGKAKIEELERFPATLSDRDANIDVGMAGYYVWNNPGIGLRCFALGLIFGIGGLFATVYNAAGIGAAFGHMATLPKHEGFFNFVTAHGPFELTGIALSAAAGMRLGFALVNTQGRRRIDSLRRRRRVPADGLHGHGAVPVGGRHRRLLVAFAGALLDQGRGGRRLDADAVVLRDWLGLPRKQPWNWTRTASPSVSGTTPRSSIWGCACSAPTAGRCAHGLPWEWRRPCC